ncbi:MAG: hypothetical protein ACNA70_07030 [Brevefilum sp.]
MLNPTRKTLHAKPEAELADYQACQVGNTCSFHMISASIHLLLNHALDPMALSDEVNRLWWRGRLMRVAPQWAVTPRMQVRIIRHLARTRGLPITASFHHGDPGSLPEVLTDLTTIPIITIIWPWRKAPPIYLGSTTQNFNATRSAGGHSMILAAYDPHHTAGDQFPTPWGFINPWVDNSPHLFWMQDNDFRRAWRFWLPGIGPNPLVLVRRTVQP